MVRLGLTARVRDIDPNGRLALVSHWRRPLRLFDLRRLAWIDIELPRRYWLLGRSVPPRLSADQRLFHGEPSLITGERLLADVRTYDLRTGAIHLISRNAPFGSTGMSATNNRYWYVTDTQQVAITTNRTQVAVTLEHVWLVDPLPRKVIHAAHVDGERDLLAAGSWSEISLHKIVDGTLERVGYTKTEANGDVKWLAVAGPWLVAAIASDPVLRITRIEVYRLDAALSIGPIVHRYTGSPLGAAALSRDGRYLALAIDGVLVVHELGTDRIEHFTEHTDDINCVRFAGDDHVLISADTDHRVVLRPRTPTGYARPLVTIDIPEQPVPLPALDDSRR